MVVYPTGRAKDLRMRTLAKNGPEQELPELGFGDYLPAGELRIVEFCAVA